ncbi:MAG: hypothetical protein HY718_11035 [Planctomycetes bacterium]|nr:hypothetical protein [Planctomycetota bacterium]
MLLSMGLARQAAADGCEARWLSDESRVGANGIVRVLTPSPDGPFLYAGGEFTEIGGVSANRIARFDGHAWAPLGSGFDGTVWTIAVLDLGTGPTLYAGGDFTFSGSTAIAHVAQWDGEAWSAVGTGTNGGVYALASYQTGVLTSLYAAGQFTQAGDVSVSNIAKWDGAGWSAVGAGVTGAPVSLVRALAVYDSGNGPELVAAGLFTSPAKNIARWNGSAWLALTTGVSGTANTLLTWDGGSGNALYVGGFFTSAGSVTDTVRIARWNGSAWSALGQGLRDEPVNALAGLQDGNGPALYAGGQFTFAGTLSTRRVARWDGSSWSALGASLQDDDSDPCWCGEPFCDCGPRPAVVHVMAAYRGLVYVGGDFTHVECDLTADLARWGCQPSYTVPADFDWDGVVDGDDVLFFESCATGPTLQTIEPCCEPADLNNDGSVDLIDFAMLQRCLTLDPGSAPLPGCQD